VEPAKPKHILVVEDDKSLRDALVERFQSEGFNVQAAENGLVGLRKYQADHVDAILLDLYMPVMDGHAFLDKLRSLTGGDQVPVIILSNMVDHDYVVDAFDKGIVDYFLKANTNLDTVVQKIKNTLAI
jgi:CheY-like chemotaxis protein